MVPLLALADPPALHIVADWRIRIDPGEIRVGRRRIRIAASQEIAVAPAHHIAVRDERIAPLPLFDEKQAPWNRGARLYQLVTFETTAAGMLAPESLVVKTSPGQSRRYAAGSDFAFDPQWATVGRLPGGAIAENQSVWVDYEAGWGRLDAIVVDRDGMVSLRQGTPHRATPLPPDPRPGEVRLAHVWVPGRLARLAQTNLYPIHEARYLPPRPRGGPAGRRLLPRTWAKLNAGEPVHVLAWGDSVTTGAAASEDAHTWQRQFVARLQARFAGAKIRLTTLAWGGRTSDHFLAEPPGSPFHFEEKLLGAHPDLVVMEFVNDAWMDGAAVEAKYLAIKGRFDAAGIEWAILTPHFVRPDWMGLSSDRVETDPRPYVAAVRAFGPKHGVAVGDASRRWEHLAKEGIPYMTLLSNVINHPDDRGHALFAESLMELFL